MNALDMNALDRLTAYLCQRPGTGHMDAHHADVARQILTQHARELAAAGAGESGVISLADRLREAATALAARSDIAETDDPLTLLRCLHATVEALREIAPAALAAADLDGKTVYMGAGVADIPGRVAVGLGSATNALWDAYNSI
jgi:hypothetical protein